MSRDLSAHAAWLVPNLTVLKPPGEGPFPVVVQMHGCAGGGRIQTVYGQAACAAGVAVVIVDSLAPRGISRLQARLSVCTGAVLRGAERAGDLLAILAWLAEQPWADPARVAASGWSHGAWAVMEALAAPATSEPPAALGSADLKLACLFYPYAGPLARTAKDGWGGARPQVFACLAGRDTVVGRTAPLRALRRLEADGLAVQILHLPEATHAFDDDQASDPRFVYRSDLTAQACEAYVEALTGVLLAGAPPAAG